ncbi:hypothetical protein [Bacteroides thetaiotaomicron]|uniref:hypothetical protein n=1 Tax=Bacteroides thetaiotaomicron TaxID=818 RepID=UPI0021655206|nr:hypothetical protein [Bacteroides thetaiotaomicron]MCS3079955.1 hypothetical protein [Bacteroides thetaiotaomicron]
MFSTNILTISFVPLVVYILLRWGGHYPSIENSGTFDNRGFEITVKHRNHIGKFNYSLNGDAFVTIKCMWLAQADNTKPYGSRLRRGHH